MVQNHQTVLAVDMPQTGGSKYLDDDGKNKRTGSVWTASAHIITAVIGSGVLSLAWATAQLGWLAGPVVMLLFSAVTYFTSSLLLLVTAPATLSPARGTTLIWMLSDQISVA